MLKNDGFTFLDFIIVVTITMILISFSFVRIRKQNNLKNLNIAKILIYETYKKYAVLALDQRKEYHFNFDFKLHKITVFDGEYKILEEIDTPHSVSINTVYSDVILDKIESKITINGNITPIYSIYLFDSKKIAKYRISLYGFNTLKFLQINIYKNINDKKPTENGIINFHNTFNPESSKLWEKE
ncbi:hypothetical protein [Fusobacterium sp. PH5-44]